VAPEVSVHEKVWVPEARVEFGSGVVKILIDCAFEICVKNNKDTIMSVNTNNK